MTTNEINIAIAESVGWDCDPESARGWGSRGQWVIPPVSFQYIYPHKKGGLISKKVNVPSYTTDLNAMHEVEKTLGDQMTKYSWLLEEVVGVNQDKDVWYFPLTATAAQRAEAYLKTINKWES